MEPNTVISTFQRREVKFFVDERQRRILESVFQGHMVPDQYGESTICNIYYDTPDYRMIRRSLEKPIYKEKLRMRSYGPVAPENTVFLEIKKKFDGVVYKRRIELSQGEAEAYMAGRAPLPQRGQIGREIDYLCRSYGQLLPTAYISYDRCAYFGAEDDSFRATFDRNACWRREAMSLTARPGGQLLFPREMSLLEVKTPDAIPLWLVRALSAAGIRQSSFSKYGTAYQSMARQRPQRDANQERKGVIPCA